MKEEYIAGIVNVIELGNESLERFTRERLMSDSEIPLWSKVGRNKFTNFHSAVSQIIRARERFNNATSIHDFLTR